MIQFGLNEIINDMHIPIGQAFLKCNTVTGTIKQK